MAQKKKKQKKNKKSNPTEEIISIIFLCFGIITLLASVWVLSSVASLVLLGSASLIASFAIAARNSKEEVNKKL